VVPAIITATPGNWIVNVSVSPSNTSATVQLNLVRIDSVLLENRFINFFFTVGDTYLYESLRRYDNEDSIMTVSISPSSGLLQQAGSVAFIRRRSSNAARFVIGSQLSSFNSTCVLNTLMHVRASTKIELMYL
jgi:hypothetical protein